MRSFLTAYGLIYAVCAMPMAIAPLIVGHAYELTGSHTKVLTFLSAVTAIIGVGMIALPLSLSCS